MMNLNQLENVFNILLMTPLRERGQIDPQVNRRPSLELQDGSEIPYITYLYGARTEEQLVLGLSKVIEDFINSVGLDETVNFRTSLSIEEVTNGYQFGFRAAIYKTSQNEPQYEQHPQTK